MCTRLLRGPRVAHDLGVTLNSFWRVVCGHNNSPSLRRQIEIYFRTPFWTPPAEFEARLGMIDAAGGVDPEACSRRELFALADRHGIKLKARTKMNRAALVAGVEKHFRDLTSST